MYNNSDGTKCQVLFVDPAQNPDLVVGLSWGTFDTKGNSNSLQTYNTKRYPHPGPYLMNPADSKNRSTGNYAEVLVAKSCQSWDKEARDKPRSKVIINNPSGYRAYLTGELPPEETEDTGTEDKTETKSSTYVSTSNGRSTVRFQIKLKDSPYNYAQTYKVPILVFTKKGFVNEDVPTSGDGAAHCIAWFSKGERLTLVSSSDQGNIKNAEDEFKDGWTYQNVDFDLEIVPFTPNVEWSKINTKLGNYLGNEMSWNDDDKIGFDKGFNLINFLPSSIKINDWLDNFCKSFNLELKQIDQHNFELNTHSNYHLRTSCIIDLDNRVNVKLNRTNEPLGLPAFFELGFTVDKEEEGFVKSCDKDEDKKPILETGDDGGGKYATGSIDNKTVKQTSNFSYNWLKTINVMKKELDSEGKPTGKSVIDYTVSLPVISDKEVWQGDSENYTDMQKKKYLDKAQRFWYRKTKSDERYLLPVKINNQLEVQAALVDNQYQGALPMKLHYRNEPDSIMRNYFVTLFADGNNSFTTVECYLTAEEYCNLDRSLIRFNGDLYYVAEIDGYDPLEKKKATLKLLRKIL